MERLLTQFEIVNIWRRRTKIDFIDAGGIVETGAKARMRLNLVPLGI